MFFEYGEEQLPESGRSSVADDNLLDDEEAVGELIKSLITANGLRTAWARIGKRLRHVERGLQRTSQIIERMPHEYVPRAEFNDVVGQQRDQLTGHERQIGRFNGLIEDLSHIVRTEQQCELNQLKQALADSEAAHRHMKCELEAANKTKDEDLNCVAGDLRNVRTVVDGLLAGGVVSEDQLRVEFEKSNDGVENKLEALDARLRQFSIHETDLSLRRLVSIEESQARNVRKDGDDLGVCDHLKSTTGSNTVSQVSASHQENLLKLVSSKLVDVVQRNLQETYTRLDDLVHEVSLQKDDLSCQIRRCEKASIDCNMKLETTAAKIAQDMAARSTISEMTSVRENFTRQVESINTQIGDNKELVLRKFSEFVDHFSKVHQTIDDHEHCIRHHAEEIENRCTKYDLLVCRSQVDRCIKQDEFNKEVEDLKKAVAWQTSKIEKFGLMVGVSSSSSLAPGKQSRKRSPKPRRAVLELTRRLSLDANQGPPSNEDTDTDEGNLLESKSLTPSPTVNANESEEVCSQAGSERSDRDDKEMIGEANHRLLLREQLEVVAMGLLALAHQTFRQVRVGESRKARVAQEKDLLNELQCAFQWISDSIEPPGWKRGRLTTIALSTQAKTQRRSWSPNRDCSSETAVGEFGESSARHDKGGGGDTVVVDEVRSDACVSASQLPALKEMMSPLVFPSQLLNGQTKAPPPAVGAWSHGRGPLSARGTTRQRNHNLPPLQIG